MKNHSLARRVIGPSDDLKAPALTAIARGPITRSPDDPIIPPQNETHVSIW